MVTRPALLAAVLLPGPIRSQVDLSSLFAPPTPPEVALVAADWAGRLLPAGPAG